MTNDPIVDEIRKTRQALLDACGGDLDKLLDRYKAAEQNDQARLVTLEDVRARKKQRRDVGEQ